MFKTGVQKKDIQIVLSVWNNLYISYDSMSMNTASKGITLAEYDFKADEGLSQIPGSLFSTVSYQT